MKKVIVALLVGSIWSLSAFANSNETIRLLAERPFSPSSSSDEIGNFVRQLPRLTSQVELQQLPELVSGVASLDGENQFGSFKAAAILWETAKQYDDKEDFKPNEVKVWFELFEIVENSSIHKGLLGVLGAIMAKGCSNSLTNSLPGWWRRETGNNTENHRFCQDKVIPKYFEYATKVTDNETDELTGVTSSALLSALINIGYVHAEFSPIGSYDDGTISIALVLNRNAFYHTFYNMRLEALEELIGW